MSAATRKFGHYAAISGFDFAVDRDAMVDHLSPFTTDGEGVKPRIAA